MNDPFASTLFKDFRSSHAAKWLAYIDAVLTGTQSTRSPVESQIVIFT